MVPREESVGVSPSDDDNDVDDDDEVASCPFVHFLCCVKIPPCVVRQRRPTSTAANCSAILCCRRPMAVRALAALEDSLTGSNSSRAAKQPRGGWVRKRGRWPPVVDAENNNANATIASSFYPGKNLVPSLHSTFFFLVLLGKQQPL